MSCKHKALKSGAPKSGSASKYKADSKGNGLQEMTIHSYVATPMQCTSLYESLLHVLQT